MRPCKEEKTIFGLGEIDEGNWLKGQFTGNKGRSWGIVEMPLCHLPVALQNRAKKGKRLHIRLLISGDGEQRVTQSDAGAYRYKE